MFLFNLLILNIKKSLQRPLLVCKDETSSYSITLNWISANFVYVHQRFVDFFRLTKCHFSLNDFLPGSRVTLYYISKYTINTSDIFLFPITIVTIHLLLIPKCTCILTNGVTFSSNKRLFITILCRRRDRLVSSVHVSKLRCKGLTAKVQTTKNQRNGTRLILWIQKDK